MQAALGLAMVDESVFALSELQPGLEKIYFTLEKELMEPKYEIHGLKPTGLLQPGPARCRDPTESGPAARRRAAAGRRAAAQATSISMSIPTRQRWQKVASKVVQVMQATHQKMLNAIQKYRADTKASLTAEDSLTLLVRKGYLQEADLLDPWGNFYKTKLYGAEELR